MNIFIWHFFWKKDIIYYKGFFSLILYKEGAYMDTVVMKFGGSSVADNEKLNIVANKIIDVFNQNNNVVVIVSAQRENYR